MQKPSAFSILYRYFLPRVIDLEALTRDGDLSKLLGQIASVLLMISLVLGGTGLLFDIRQMPQVVQADLFLGMEHRLLALTLVVVGVFSVLSWNSIFPDKRDVMMLGVLPFRSSTLFTAKLAASASALSVAVVTLNCVSGLVWPLAFHHDGIVGALRSVAAHWATILLAGIWMFAAVISVQGLLTLILPRQYALRISAFFQISAFCCLLTTYFMEPGMVTVRALETPHVSGWIVWSPSYWFVGLDSRMMGGATPGTSALAARAEWSLLLLVFLAASTWLYSYFRLMRKIVEVPDIQSGAVRVLTLPLSPASVREAVWMFSIRSLLRSSQHRMVLAFYLGVGFAVALSTLRLPATAHDVTDIANVIDLRLLIASIAMTCFSIAGVRMIFAMPVHLPANWLFHVTELWNGDKYLSAARTALVTLSLAPTLLLTFCIGAITQPLRPLLLYVATLAFLGGFFIELALLRFNSVPFTCARQPGKRNVGFAFWLYLLLLVPLTEWVARLEQKALQHGPLSIVPVVVLLPTVFLMHRYNNGRARSTSLRFDDAPAPALQSLGL